MNYREGVDFFIFKLFGKGRPDLSHPLFLLVNWFGEGHVGNLYLLVWVIFFIYFFVVFQTDQLLFYYW